MKWQGKKSLGVLLCILFIPLLLLFKIPQKQQVLQVTKRKQHDCSRQFQGFYQNQNYLLKDILSGGENYFLSLSRTALLGCRNTHKTEKCSPLCCFQSRKILLKHTKFFYLIVPDFLLVPKIYLSLRDSESKTCSKTGPVRCSPNQGSQVSALPGRDNLILRTAPKKLSFIFSGTFISTAFYFLFLPCCILQPQGFNNTINLALEKHRAPSLVLKCW